MGKKSLLFKKLFGSLMAISIAASLCPVVVYANEQSESVEEYSNDAVWQVPQVPHIYYIDDDDNGDAYDSAKALEMLETYNDSPLDHYYIYCDYCKQWHPLWPNRPTWPSWPDWADKQDCPHNPLNAKNPSDDPDNPNDPDNPDDPNDPDNPDNPDDPYDPNNPDNPHEQDKPNDPEPPLEVVEPEVVVATCADAIEQQAAKPEGWSVPKGAAVEGNAVTSWDSLEKWILQQLLDMPHADMATFTIEQREFVAPIAGTIEQPQGTPGYFKAAVHITAVKEEPPAQTSYAAMFMLLSDEPSTQTSDDDEQTDAHLASSTVEISGEIAAEPFHPLANGGAAGNRASETNSGNTTEITSADIKNINAALVPAERLADLENGLGESQNVKTLELSSTGANNVSSASDPDGLRYSLVSGEKSKGLTSYSVIIMFVIAFVAVVVVAIILWLLSRGVTSRFGHKADNTEENPSDSATI